MGLSTKPVRFSNTAGVPLCYRSKCPLKNELSLKTCWSCAEVPFVIVCVTAVDIVWRRFLGSCLSLSWWTSGGGGSPDGRAGSSFAFHWNIDTTRNNGIPEWKVSLIKLRTTLQSIMNAKFSKHGFWHCHENGPIKTIQMIPHNLYESVKSASLYWGLG